MVTEDYVSFETAKLLKEKGFDSDGVGCLGGFYSERCYESGHGITTQSGQEVGIVYDDLTNSDLEYDEYLRPTLQMAMKWLREKHNQNITVKAHNNVARLKTIYYAEVQNLSEPAEKGFCVNGCTFKDTYEEAVEYAIRYCLENLI